MSVVPSLEASYVSMTGLLHVVSCIPSYSVACTTTTATATANPSSSTSLEKVKNERWHDTAENDGTNDDETRALLINTSGQTTARTNVPCTFDMQSRSWRSTSVPSTTTTGWRPTKKRTSKSCRYSYPLAHSTRGVVGQQQLGLVR